MADEDDVEAEEEHDPDDDWAICGGCSGSGEGMTEHSRCSTCKGKGVVYVGEPIEPDEPPCDDKWESMSKRDLDRMAVLAENAMMVRDE